jgi:hypothetical protein
MVWGECTRQESGELFLALGKCHHFSGLVFSSGRLGVGSLKGLKYLLHCPKGAASPANRGVVRELGRVTLKPSHSLMQ